MIKSEQNKRDEKIKQLYLGGESVRMIAARFGLSTQQINNIVNRFFPERKKHLTNNLKGV
jgi:transposase